MTGIVVKNYEGFNRAMGKYITSKKHYQDEMRKGGYCTFEKAEELASKARRENHKPYEGLSDKARGIINTVKQQDKKNFKLSDRTIDAMKELGVRFERQELPNDKGGFQ